MDTPDAHISPGLDPEMRKMILDTLDRAASRLFPKERVLALDRDGIFPEADIRAFFGPEIGLQLLFIPEQFGGMGAGAADCCAVTRRMSGICLGISTGFFAVQLGLHPILTAGTPAQKEKWLGKVADGKALVAYAVTEPDAGSNVAALKTRAEPVTDGNGNLTGYRIFGNKQFISNGGYADFMTVLAATPEGPSFFIVTKDDEGFFRGKAEKKHGIRASDTSALSFDGVFVGPDRLVGETPGKGLKQAGEVFGYTRLMVAAMALGAGEAAMKIAVEYANTRVQFQTVLSKKQGYTHKLILPHAVRLAAADAYIETVAHLADAGKTDLQAESGMAKLFATEAADKAAGDFMQALGGYGYMAEYEVEKIRRDIKITCIYEGTSEIQQSIISTLRWRKQVKSRGGFYADKAGEMRELSGNHPDLGANLAADALEACGHTLMLAHENRLTRQQHLMFRMADMMTWAEVAAALCQKAAGNPDGPHARRLELCARIFAAEAADKAAQTVRFMAFGTGVLDDARQLDFLAKTAHDRLMKADQGLLPLMDELAGMVFGG